MMNGGSGNADELIIYSAAVTYLLSHSISLLPC